MPVDWQVSEHMLDRSHRPESAHINQSVCTERGNTPGHSQTQIWLTLTPSLSICFCWSKFYWTNSLYLAHALLILWNNNTHVPGSSCSQHSGFANFREEQGKALNSSHVHWCNVCGFRLFKEAGVPHSRRTPLPTPSSCLRARRQDEMLVLKRAVYQFGVPHMPFTPLSPHENCDLVGNQQK